MAQKKFELKFDIDSKDVEIVSDRVLTLTEQARILKKELSKDDKTPEQFAILASKLNETKDAAAATEARSRELFGTLQLIPGPIGEIASKIDGTISLLKTFSGFKLADIKNQISALASDIGGLVKWLGQATGITKVYTILNNALSKSFVAVGVGEQAAATGARAFAAALTATGIGALVVGLGLAVSALMAFTDGTKEAEDAQEKLNASLKNYQDLLKVELDETEFVTKMRIANAKKLGKSQQEIDAITAEGEERKLKNLRDNFNRLDKLQGDANYRKKLSLEDAKKLDEEFVKANKAYLDEVSRQELSAAERSADQAVRQRQEKKTTGERAAAEERDRRSRELDATIQLEKDKGNTDLKTLEDLLYKKWLLTMEGKKISEKEKEAARQKAKQDAQKEIDEDIKVNEDRIKNQEDFQKKLRDLKTAAILDDVERTKQERLDRLNDDLAALEKDKEFIKLSEEEKAKVRKNVKAAFDRDIKKIDEDLKKSDLEKEKKSYDDKLRLLELQGQGLLQGTLAYYENRKAILDASLAKELAGVEKGSAEELAIRKKYAELNKELDKEKIASTGKVLSATFDALGGLTAALASSYDEEAKTSEAAFNKRKRLQKSTALMSAASGIVQILTQPSTLPSPFDWIVKGVNAAALAISTAVQIKKIDQTQFEAPTSPNTTTEPYKVVATRASGGIVSGEGTSTSDSIPARLSNGEYVVNARATSAFLPLLNAINDAGRQPRFAMGGLYNNSSMGYDVADNITNAISSSLTMTPIKTYVVSQEMTTSQQLDRQRKSRSTI